MTLINSEINALQTLLTSLIFVVLLPFVPPLFLMERNNTKLHEGITKRHEEIDRKTQ